MDKIDIQDQITDICNKIMMLEAAITNQNRTLDDVGAGVSIVLCEVRDELHELSTALPML